MAIRHLTAGAPLRTRTLVLELEEPDVRDLERRKFRFALARASRGASPNAVWLAWDPQAVSTVTWTETYSVYAGMIPERSGAPIHVLMSAQPAVEQAVHFFIGQAFAPPVAADGLPRGHFGVKNASHTTAAFGLLQAARVNDVLVDAPLNAIVLPAGHSTEFTNFDTVHVWAQTDVFGGTAAGPIIDATTIVYAEHECVKHYRYDGRSKRFLLF